VPDVVPDKTTVEGFFDTPYPVPHQRHAHVAVPSPLPIGNFRGVGHSLTGFFMESFIDELAAHLGKDPLVLRRELLASKPQHLAVLNLAAEKAGYSEANRRALKAQGRALGLAIHQSFSSIVAQVAEVSVEDLTPRVHRVVSAVDVGLAVNPDVVAQQIEGAVVMGLSAALYGHIDVEQGRVKQGYFTDYRLLSIDDAPIVETHIVKSQEAPRGIGEPGLPAIAPRRRQCPVRPHRPTAAFATAHPRLSGRNPMIALQINGKRVDLDVAPDTPLLWVLRDHLNLTGTKFGCGIGACGACTVLVEGNATPSCKLALSEVAGKQISTIEAVAADPVGKALQDAWVAHNVPQCGYCQSGQIMSAIALLKRKPNPSDADVDADMRNNLCRCGTYQRIRAAIKDAAQTIGKR